MAPYTKCMYTLHSPHLRTLGLGILCVALYISSASSIFAQTASVSSFTATPASVSYGLTTLLSWVIQDGAGANLYFECPQGITISRDGVAFPCNVSTSMGVSNSDSAVFKMTNVSGNTETVVAKIIPKSTGGAEVTDASVSRSITVLTVPQPLTDFTVIPATVESSADVVFSWTGVGISLANMQFSCPPQVRITNTTGEEIPCGTRAFTTDLPASGSQTVRFINTTGTTQEVRAFMWPAVLAGVYDATHALSRSVFVKTAVAAPKPEGVSLKTSADFIHPDSLLEVTWSTAHAQGANIFVQCEPALYVMVQGSTTVPCNRSISSSSLGESGTTSLSFVYTGYTPQTVQLQLLVQNSDGTSILTPFAKKVTVYPKGMALPASLSLGAPSVSSSNMAAIYSPPSSNQGMVSSSLPRGTTIQKNGVVTISLERGMKHAQVRILQAILAQDTELYPTGEVTGFFGALTEAAVKRFQLRYGIAKPGDAGYGFIGPKTRAKLNSMTTF